MMYEGTHATGNMWRLEGNSVGSVFSFHLYMGSENQLRPPGMGSKWFMYMLSHLIGLQIPFIFSVCKNLVFLRF